MPSKALSFVLIGLRACVAARISRTHAAVCAAMSPSSSISMSRSRFAWWTVIVTCVEFNQCVGCIDVEDDAMIQHERAVKF